MVDQAARNRTQGFSLVEMVVAMAFILVLMVGMSAVFKTSLSTSFTSGEVLASARRNRMSIDVLGNDLNTAEMYLADLSQPPVVQSTNPPFYILPNMPIVGAGANDPQTSDQLFFYLDQPLPFQGTLQAAGTAMTASQMVAAGTATGIAANSTFTITCPNGTYANQVAIGQLFMFEDSWEIASIQTAPLVGAASATGPTPVTVVAGAGPYTAVTGVGATGLPIKNAHLAGSGVIFILPAQMVRYSVQMLQLDPMNANGIPCLVRDQGTYNGAGFVATLPQEIITENIGQGPDPAQSGFKVYLSVNSGQAWEGVNFVGTGFSGGWDLGIRTQLDTQLALTGRQGFQTTRFSDHWFRSIPTLVRVDLTTRTAVQRTEYNTAAPNTLAYKNFTQTLVFVPAHSGLPLT